VNKNAERIMEIARVNYVNFFSILAKWIVWGGIIGLLAGSASALLIAGNDFLTEVRFANPSVIYLLPVGGLIIGYIYQKYGNEADKGNNLIYEHVHHGQGKIPLIMGPIVFISTFITHLLGGSTGREGAAIQMAGSISESVIRIFKLSNLDRKIMLMSGISGGFGSAFGTPVAGAIMGMEVASLGKMKYEALIPCFTASFVGHLVTTAWGIEHKHNIIESIPGLTASTIVKVIIVSIIFSFASVLYSQMRHGVEKYSTRFLKNFMLRAMVGGIIIIALVFIVGSGDYLGRGLPMIDEAFVGQVPPLAFLAKIVFTAITMGSGFRGGEVIPLFFMGATLGNTLAPIVDLPVSFLAALGLVAVFCGGTNIPITCFVFSIETFEGEGVLYFFLACLTSYIFSGHHGVWPSQKIYAPKSIMLGLPDGESIASIEKKKENK
jgi:H+/Cl- antiporter ClcA